MYVAYNRFYPPELATIEARNASPDRSHNETFDALIITGVVGFMAWQFLYLATFYYGLRFIGVIRGKRDRNLLVACWIVGAIVTTIIFVNAFEVQFLGVSIPFGSVLGLITYLIYYALSANRDQLAMAFSRYDSRTLLVGSLVAALIAFYVEIHFGIAIAATRVYSFALMALIVVVGSLPAPKAVAEVEDAPVIASNNAPRRRPRGRRGVVTPNRAEQGIVWGGVVVLSVLFGTLIFNFVNFTPMPGEIEQWRSATDLPSSFEILSRSLFVNPRNGFENSPYLFGVLILSWLFGTLLLFSEMVKDGTLKIRQTPLLADKRWTQIGAGLLLAIAILMLTTWFEAANPDTANSQRIGRVLSTGWALTAAVTAVGLFAFSTQPLIRPMAGAVAAMGVLFGLPTVFAGARLNGILLIALSVGVLYVLWDNSWRTSFVSLLTLGSGSFLLGMLYAMIHGGLVRASFIAPSDVNGPLEGLTRRVVEAERVGQYLTVFYGFVIMLLLIAGAAYAWHWISAEKQDGSLFSYVLLLVAMVGGLFFIDYASLNLIQADMTYKRGRPYDQQAGQIVRQINSLQGDEQMQAVAQAIDIWDSAVAVYERTVEMAPNEDFYYLWLGRAYLEESQVNLEDQTALLDTAEERLLRAQVINPLNTDHTANLARLNVRWAQLVGPDLRQTHIDAAKGYYQDALALSPQNSIIRNEYGGLLLSLDNDCEGAINTYVESTEVDPYYEQTYLRLSETYLNCFSQVEGQDIAYINEAAATLDAMLENVTDSTRRRVEPQAASFELRVAQAYLTVGDLVSARATVEAVAADFPDLQPQVNGLLAQIEAAEGTPEPEQ